MNRSRSRSTSGYGGKRGPETPAVHTITGAAQAHSDDLDVRIRRYLISMGIRTVCFLLVLAIHSPIRWAFAVLAIVLPYVAVVMANAVGRRRGPGAQTVQVVRIPLSGGTTNGSAPAQPARPAETSDFRSDASPERTN